MRAIRPGGPDGGLVVCPISANDFSRIEAEMEKIVAENRPFTRYELPVGDGGG